MDFLELAKNRYSSRSYLDKKVEQEKTNNILEAAKLTPTAVNKFPIKLVVVESKTGLEKIKKCTKFDFNAPLFKKCTKFDFNAPLCIICGYSKSEAWTRKSDNKNYGVVDASLAMMQMMLEATNVGLATCFIGVFDEIKVKQEFNIKDDIEVVGLLMIGYPLDEPSLMHFTRKNICDFVEYK